MDATAPVNVDTIDRRMRHCFQERKVNVTKNRPLFEVGVRRAIASQQAGLNSVPAKIFIEGQTPVIRSVPLSQLFSPKPEIPLDVRLLNIQPPIQTPIQVQPLGLPGQIPTVPLNQVRLVPPGGG